MLNATTSSRFREELGSRRRSSTGTSAFNLPKGACVKNYDIKSGYPLDCRTCIHCQGTRLSDGSKSLPSV